VDSFVRVKIRRTFGNSSDAGGFAEEPGLDPEMIEIHYNTDLWKYEDDGYWYYKDVLRAGKSTEKPLMDSYYLSEKADNRYKNKEARIIVNLESIQAEGGEMKNIWGKEEKDLGIRYQPCTCETVTSVVFDQNHRLTIGGESTDLFANFEKFTAYGCSRSQTIRLSNTSDNYDSYVSARGANKAGSKQSGTDSAAFEQIWDYRDPGEWKSALSGFCGWKSYRNWLEYEKRY